jgi:hypothetical protein
MQSRARSDSRFFFRTSFVGFISVCWLQAAVAVASGDSALDPAEAQAQASWRADIAQIEVPAAGCFQADYPNLYWERVACAVGKPRAHSVSPKFGGEVVGNGHDYEAVPAAGFISEARGTFPSVTGVTREKSVGVAAMGGGGILGLNEYSLQLNTNFTDATSACQLHISCVVGQQFVYATDITAPGEAGVFMEYWLIGWGFDVCPSDLIPDGEGNCFGDSDLVPVPDLKIRDLAGETLTASAVAGGNDTVRFTHGGHAYSVSGPDSVLDISSVWAGAEFNVVGDAGGSRAVFNTGSSITVKVAVTSGTTAKPFCLRNHGSTVDTNNLNLGSCTGSTGTTPSIQFTESN